MKKRDGMRAWRRLTGRYDTKRDADKEAAYQRVLDPGRYIGKAKTAEGALDALTKWENEITRYEGRFGRKLEEDTMRVKVREIMPDFLFGESGPFRGKTFEGWEEMRSEIVRYLEDRPRTKVTGIGSNINHLPGKIGEEKGKDDEEEGDWIWSVEVDDWICILRKGKGKGGKSKGKGKG